MELGVKVKDQKEHLAGFLGDNLELKEKGMKLACVA